MIGGELVRLWQAGWAACGRTGELEKIFDWASGNRLLSAVSCTQTCIEATSWKVNGGRMPDGVDQTGTYIVFEHNIACQNRS